MTESVSGMTGLVEERVMEGFDVGFDESVGDNFRLIEERMLARGQSRLAIETFRHYYLLAVRGETGMIASDAIEPVTDVVRLDQLGEYFSAGARVLGRAVIIKLNGGLGTNMGLDRAKTLLPAKDGLRFIDIILNQVMGLREEFQIPLPLLFMDSFRTQRDSAEVVKAAGSFLAGQNQIPYSFVQNMVPKILKDNWRPVDWSKDREAEWCPPGHGDIYTALLQTGLMDRLLERGYRYAFVSNGDNLCAQMDLRILGFMAKNEIPFLMEVAERREMDKKGGHVARQLGQNNLVLRESAQCPQQDLADFQDIDRWRYFNTNNNWLDLAAVREKMAANNNILELPLIRNAKRVDPSDCNSPAVYQLETAMGSAISLFPNAQVLCVPRCRFAPVKKTNDLLLLRSDVYELENSRCLKQICSNSGEAINIELDHCFDLIDQFDKRFPFGAPSLIECSSLKVRGDIVFGRNVKCQGDVIVVNESNGQIHIADGQVLTGEVVFSY